MAVDPSCSTAVANCEVLGPFRDKAIVRRRCRFLVVVDAGKDAKFAFEDLGNAVRKIYIDFAYGRWSVVRPVYLSDGGHFEDLGLYEMHHD